jgi:membrane protein required for colicin V production
MNGSLNLLDIALVAIVGISTLFGILKGFIGELFSLVFLIIGLILSFLYYPEAAVIFSKHLSKQAANAAGFAAIFVVVLLLGVLVTYFIRKIFIRGPIRTLDRILGAVFGALRGVLIAALIVIVMAASRADNKLLKQSRLSPHLLEGMKTVFKLTPEKFKEKKDILIDDLSRQKNR